MFRLKPPLLQQLWDLRATGTSIRRIAVVLGVSRNTVRRYVRRAVHGSGFPPPLDARPAWPAKARAIIALDPALTSRSIAARLRVEGIVVSMRSVQRELAKWRGEQSLLAAVSAHSG